MDWTHINTLLSIIHQASEAGPKFSKVASMATDELMAYVENPDGQAPEGGDEDE